MTLASWLDGIPPDRAAEVLSTCCGALQWIEGMLDQRPFGDDASVYRAAEQVWARARRGDVLEALMHHPEIGADIELLRQRFAATAAMSEGEQSGVALASEDTLVALRDGNIRYRQTFGHIFVVCATGKSAAEMLALLQARLSNDPETEIEIAKAEQDKITRLRLEKLAAAHAKPETA